MARKDAEVEDNEKDWEGDEPDEADVEIEDVDPDELDDDLDLDLDDALIDDEGDDDEDDDDDDNGDDGGDDDEALDELEAEELEMLTEDEEAESLPVDEAAEMRKLRREAIALDAPAESVSDGEFVCASCFLVKRSSQLADKRKKLCRDCA